MLMKTAFAALALVGATLIPLADACAGPRQAYAQCMTDDGYGRYRPCDSSYKQQNQNWWATDACMTDDGYGRYRPCDSSFKQRHAGSAR